MQGTYPNTGPQLGWWHLLWDPEKQGELLIFFKISLTSFARPPQSTGLFPPLGHPSLDFVHSYATTSDSRHPQTTLCCTGNQSATQGRLNISVVFDLLRHCNGVLAKVERQNSTAQLQKSINHSHVLWSMNHIHGKMKYFRCLNQPLDRKSVV